MSVSGEVYMQDKNRSFQNPPKVGDGTLREREPEPDANWFGQSQEPQEEFINNGVDQVGPTPGNEVKPRSQSTPVTPPDVFPYGDPSQQSDG